MRWFIAALFISASASQLAAQAGNPSRAAVKGCKWERASDNTASLAAWVQRCDFGKRKINLFFKANALMQQFSDGGAPDALIEVFAMRAGETFEAAVQRVYAEHTPKDTAAKCVIAPYTLGKGPAGAKRYTFIPNAAYERALKAKANPNEVPEPPCGSWGTAPDGQQFFEVWPTSTVRKLLFVRVGQDEPLFDELTLQLLPATPPAKSP